METSSFTSKYRQQLLDDRSQVADGSEHLTDSAVTQLAEAFGHLEAEYGVPVLLSTDPHLPDGVVAATFTDTYPAEIHLGVERVNASAESGHDTHHPGPYGVAGVAPGQPSSVGYIAAHEYGHALLLTSADTDQYWDYLVAAATPHWLTLRWDVSAYATVNPVEFAGEVFALTHQARHARKLSGLKPWVRTLGNQLHQRHALAE